MSYAPTGLHGCPDIQAELDTYFGTCDSSMASDPSPLNEFLWSPSNRSDIELLIHPGSNKVRTGVLRYDQRILESEVGTRDDCDQVCVATTKRGDLTSTFEIDTCDRLFAEELMNPEDFKNACRDNGQIIAKKIAMLMDVLERKIATVMVGLAVTKYGNWANGVSPLIADAQGNAELALSVNTYRAGTTDINPEAAYDIDFAIKQTGYCMSPLIVAGGTLYKYLRLMESGCCANQGLALDDIFAKYGHANVWDRRYDLAMGGDGNLYGMVVQPRVLQPVYYTRALDGVWGALGLTVGANYQKQGVVSRLGIPMDLTISDNCGEISFILEAVVDLFALPTDLFAPGDYMEGVTFVNKIKVVNT